MTVVLEDMPCLASPEPPKLIPWHPEVVVKSLTFRPKKVRS
jgi:hypothetical protein